MDLDRDAKRILDLATEARAPAAGDKARVEQKLTAMLGVSALAMSPGLASEAAQHASTVVTSAKAASGSALKWWISSALIASAITGYIALSPKPAAHAPVSVPVPVPVPESPAPAPTPPIEATEAPRLEPARTVLPTKKRTAPSNLNEELELLHRAQAAWRAHEASNALSLLDEHRTRFPRSDLKLERDGLRVLTLCELGRKGEATSLAQKLLERAPRSPLRATIEESCALK